jgi:hypothetical protein
MTTTRVTENWDANSRLRTVMHTLHEILNRDSCSLCRPRYNIFFANHYCPSSRFLGCW